MRFETLAGECWICHPRPMTTNKTPILECSDYEEILNIPTHLLVVLNDQGLVERSNVSQQYILGWDSDEIIGKPLDFFLYEADRDLGHQTFSDLANQKKKSVSVTLRCRHKEGGFRWISWSAKAKDGFIFAMGLDITKWVEAESALVKEEKQKHRFQNRFTAFFEQSAFPMQIYAINGDSLVVNNAWEVMFETKRDQLAGYNLLSDPQLKSSPVLEGFHRAMQGESVEIPAIYYDPAKIGKIGRSRWLETWISPIKDDAGVIKELAMINKEVTEEIEAQLALASSAAERRASDEKLKMISERLTMTVKAGQIGLWEWIPGQDQIHWDETAENIYGATSGLLPKTIKSFNELIHPADRDLVFLTVAQSLKDKLSYRFDHRIIRNDGQVRWVQMTGVALPDEKDSPYLMIGTVMDITDRVEAIRSRDEFISIASHELKTPLQSLTLQNQMRKRNLLKGYSDAFKTENIEQMIDSDFKHLTRINRLIDDMLDISRIRAGKLTFIKQKVEFISFVQDVMERFRPQLDAVGSQVTGHYCETTVVDIDMYRVEQVIVNLLSNAMKYGAGRPIRVEVVKSDKLLQLLVHDQGPGIKNEDRGRIFERFERAISSREVTGLGLGLYICKQIMEQNQGTIKLHSELGKGSTFIVELPIMA